MFKLHITGFVSTLLFFSYSFLACAVYGLLTGTVGFLAAYTFVRRVYRQAIISSQPLDVMKTNTMLITVLSRWTNQPNHLQASPFNSLVD